jgi:Rad3-related DNA helicase
MFVFGSGTGKSFIGALLAKALHDNTTETILVVCFTNHALDQFLEDLLDIGIPQSSVVRLGSKYTPRTEPLTLQNQSTGFKFRRADWATIDSLKAESRKQLSRLQATFSKYSLNRISDRDVLSHLEFEDSAYYDAFHVPATRDGSTQVGKKGKAMSPYYLLSRWIGGHDAGVFKSSPHVLAASHIWEMSRARRSGSCPTAS